MSADRLREAFEMGYGRSRVVLIAAGNLEDKELLDEVDRWARYLPEGPPTERRTSTAYGPLPRWKKGEVTERPGPAGCVVYYLFPVESRHADPSDRLAWHLLEELCEAGGLGSPLHQLVREERQLVYSVGVDSALYPDGGYWGLAAETTPAKVERVIGAFRDFLRNRELRSAKWYDYVRRVIEAAPKMRGWDPDAFTEVAEERLTGLGAVWSDAEYLERLRSSSHREMQTLLDRLRPDEAHVVVFRGE
jgi:predicted Zn-dependent peptidase